jgi:drug/metabolite transporter (DMT)-like permease
MLSSIPKMSKILKADIQVLCAAMFFGIGFLAQRFVSVHGLGAMTCNAFRFALSTILLVIFRPYLPKDIGTEGTEEDDEGNAHLVNKSDDEASDGEADSKDSISQSLAAGGVKGREGWVVAQFKRLLGPLSAHVEVWKKSPWYWGIVLGCINFAGSGFQQWGIHYTTASKLGFIAGFDLFLTPIFGLFIPSFKKAAKAKPSTWIAVTSAVVGLYFLSGASLDDFDIGFGETLVVISTIFWTMFFTFQDIATSYVDKLQVKLHVSL